MKLYNKSGRSFILDPKNVISGGRFQEHDKKREKCYFDSEKDIEVKDVVGEKMLADYPAQLMRMDKPSSSNGKIVRRKKKG